MINGDHAYRSGVKVVDHLLCTIEPDNKHNDNVTVVKSVTFQKHLSKKLLTFMKSQHIEIMDSEVTDDSRATPEEKWVIGDGIDIPCKYRLYGPKKCKKRSSSCA